MKRQEALSVAIIGVIFGILLSLSYVNPYEDEILLSELILQLSGSRGEFAMGLTFTELLSFSLRCVPGFLIESIVGVGLYRHFCTASVYVFSRMPNRTLWYAKECGGILLSVVIYQFALLLSSILTSSCRFQIRWDMQGYILLVFHAFLYTLWTFSMGLLVNLLSVLLGSDISFTMSVGVQMVLISLLYALRIMEDNKVALTIAANLNPISHLILGWQRTSVKWLDEAIPPSDISLSLYESCIFLLCFSILIMIAGGMVVRKVDLIKNNVETGGT